MRYKRARSRKETREQQRAGQKRGLPSSWKRGRLLALALGSLGMGALLWPLSRAPQADGLDGWWLRARFGWAAGQPAPSASAVSSASAAGAGVPIVLVLMDDECAAAWKEPSILWGPHMAQALDRITRDGARVVGLDWTQTAPLSHLVPDEEKGARQDAARMLFETYDQRLAESLSRARQVVMVSEFNGSDQRGAFVLPTPELLYSLPGVMGQPERAEEFVGYANFNTRAAVLASQRPLVLHGDADAQGARNAGSHISNDDDAGSPHLIAATSFAARVVEKARGGTWSAPTRRRLLLQRAAARDGRAPQVLEGWQENSQPLGASSKPARRAPQVLARSVEPLSRIELGEDGKMLINYALARAGEASTPFTTGAFRTISMSRVASGRFRAGAFRDAIVLIGATWTGSNDFYTVPMPAPGSWTQPRQIAGVEIQAHLIRTLLDSRPITEPGAAGRWALALALSMAALSLGVALPWSRSIGATIALGALYGAFSLQIFGSQALALPLTIPVGGMIASVLLMQSYRVASEERERRAILRLWGRYAHPRVVEHALYNPQARGGEGIEAQVTVLFADLKSFTQTVEHLPPGEAIRTLNRYLGLMQECVDEFDGIVDKYLGDGLLAQWGAPDPWHTLGPHRNPPIEHHAEAAVRACQAMLDRAEELSRSLQAGQSQADAALGLQSEKTFGLRLTLHSGPATAGWVGAQRIEYTVIGDTVNVCSRLQESAKSMGADFLISQSTFESARDFIHVGRTDQVEIRGRDQPLRVYEVLGVHKQSAPTPTPGPSQSSQSSHST